MVLWTDVIDGEDKLGESRGESGMFPSCLDAEEKDSMTDELVRDEDEEKGWKVEILELRDDEIEAIPARDSGCFNSLFAASIKRRWSMHGTTSTSGSCPLSDLRPNESRDRRSIRKPPC